MKVLPFKPRDPNKKINEKKLKEQQERDPEGADRAENRDFESYSLKDEGHDD